nr:hypothetical protein [Candidatus Sigynarchaeum springense]
MRRLRKDEVERRLAICEAFEQEPTLRYVDLQARFHAGPSIVASALKGGKDEWLRLLGRAPASKTDVAPSASPGKPAITRWEYIGVGIASSVTAAGALSYKAQDEGDSEPGITGLASLGDLLGAYGKLGWELAGLTKTGKGDGVFAGTWEAVFKRPLAGKEAKR